jgi:hypothetical protein
LRERIGRGRDYPGDSDGSKLHSGLCLRERDGGSLSAKCISDHKYLSDQVC